MKRKLFILVILVIWVGCFSHNLHSQESAKYQTIDVSNGGSIVGEVKIIGAVPTPKRMKVDKDMSPCANKPKFSEDLLVSKKNKGIKNVVVSIANISKGKKHELPATNPQLDQRGCVFSPHVQIIPTEVTLEILNNDGILHNVHTYCIKNPSFNKAQPKFKKKMTAVFKFPEMIKVACDAHRWMSAWIVVAEHPYYALTAADGSFKMSDIPPGTYQLQYWHEKLGKVTKEITVKPGEKTVVNMEYKQKQS